LDWLARNSLGVWIIGTTAKVAGIIVTRETMMDLVVVFFIAFFFGYWICFVQHISNRIDAGGYCVYLNGRDKYRLARTAMSHYMTDKYIVLNLVTSTGDSTAFKTPFVVDVNKVRFFTNDGERINNVNYKTIARHEQFEENEK